MTVPLQRGAFITIEGQSGVGKTTQAAALTRHLLGKGIPTISTTEPGGTQIGEQIRNIVLQNQDFIHPHAEALLFAADRAQHVHSLVDPALARGIAVVQDRYIDSSIAYQGAGLSLNPREIKDINLWASAGVEPDLTILLDIDPAIAFSRVPEADDRIEQMEAEDPGFSRRVRNEFLAIAKREADRFIVIDGAQPHFAVTAELIRKVDAWMSRRK